MADVVPSTSQEFWRPPVLAHSQTLAASPAADLADSCALCGAEFMAGSGFCYVCGASRGGTESVAKLANLKTQFGFLRALGFQNIKHGLGLSIPSLIGLVAGGGCVLAAVIVGLVVPAQTLAEYQSLQLLRIEWLLGSIAGFAAGILLKNVSPN